MKTKYLAIFLGLVLCLFVTKKSMAQCCLTFGYDRDGNRVECLVSDDCSKEDDQTEPADCEEEFENSLSLFPNPTNGVFKVSLPVECADESAYYSVFDANGKFLQHGCGVSDEFEVDMTACPSGTYVIVVNVNYETYTKTVVKL